MKQPTLEWKYMWQHVGNTELMVSEDGVNFFPVAVTDSCPWHCGDRACWFNGGEKEHERGR
jgi:hypothetical protein